MILKVIARARRRLLWNAMAAEGARAVCTGLGLVILLLLLGTDILSWHCLVIVPAATLLSGAYLTWRRLPDGFAAAQLLDRRLGLRDALSTALFFWPARPPRRFDEGMRQAQRDYASRIAAGIDVREALPVKLPTAVYAGAVLALLASGLFGLRYGIQGRLDLRPPAAPAVAHLIEAVKSQLANLEQLLKQLQPEGSRSESEQAKLEKKTDSHSNPNSSTPPEGASGEEQTNGKQDSAMALDDPSEKPQGGKDQSSSAENAAGQGNNSGPQRRQDQGADGAEPSASDSESSLLNKARDSVANLLSAIKPQSGGRGGTRSDEDHNGRPQNGKSNGKAGADGRKQEAASSSQGEQQGAESQAQPGAGSRSAGQSRGAESDQQPGSGAGNDDGDKQIKAAEQLAAMGKISVILGKRSKDVTGATSVEVVSGAQELSTRYENRKANHDSVQAKAEHDEVPVELQGFVRKYFQEVRTSVNPGRSAGRARSTGSASRSASDPKPASKQK